MLKEEKERLIKMKMAYLEKISKMPKGSIIYKLRGKKKYPYLKYRVGNKVKTDYLKYSKDELKELELKIKQRKKYLKILKDLEKDLKILKKY